jgi:NAD(P)-dependent dehydrogenase (short-subunit alcohol dehydrogenase family)
MSFGGQLELEGRTFVVTGAAGGLGAAIARLAAARGANVVVADINSESGEATAASIRDAGDEASFVRCDVTDAEQVADLMATANDRFGSLDVLVNNAGIHEAMVSEDFTFETMSIETFDRVMSVNLRSVFLCSKAALPYLKESALGPSIVNAGSTASFVGYPFGLAYGASKGGVAILTKNLAVALATYGIRVNAYCPASTDTDMVATVSKVIGESGLGVSANPNAAQLGAHLVRRIGAPRDVAELVCFMASERASFVNGVTWLIDGGTLAWRDTVDALGMS